MTDHSEDRFARRARERADRDRNRRTRHLVLTTFAAMAERDSTISGMTLFSPDGGIEYLDAAHLRTGGRA